MEVRWKVDVTLRGACVKLVADLSGRRETGQQGGQGRRSVEGRRVCGYTVPPAPSGLLRCVTCASCHEPQQPSALNCMRLDRQVGVNSGAVSSAVKQARLACCCTARGRICCCGAVMVLHTVPVLRCSGCTLRAHVMCCRAHGESQLVRGCGLAS